MEKKLIAWVTSRLTIIDPAQQKQRWERKSVLEIANSVRDSPEGLPAGSRTACSTNLPIEILPYPLQRALVRHLSIPAEKAGRPELLPLWAGQSAKLSRYADVHSLLDTLVNEVSEIGSAVQSWSAHRQSANSQE